MLVDTKDGTTKKEFDRELDFALHNPRHPEYLLGLMDERGIKGAERNNLIASHIEINATKLPGRPADEEGWKRIAEEIRALGDGVLTPEKAISFLGLFPRTV